MQPLHILETCLYAEDLDAAEQFYRDVLDLIVVSRQASRHVFFRCDQTMLLIFNPEASNLPADVPSHGARGAGHLAFGIGSGELERWQTRLADHGVPIESEVTWPSGHISLYFRDPAGNSVELASPQIWGVSVSSTAGR